MVITKLADIPGRAFPAGRSTQNLVGGSAPIQAESFRMGYVQIKPNGGQIPWHNHEQEEVYFIVDGVGEMCVGEEIQQIEAGQAVYIPSGTFHQLTNIGATPIVMIYCYSPAGEVAHWRQELDGALPEAGVDAPPLPAGASPQHGDTGHRERQ